MERRNKRSIHLVGGDMSFGHIDVMDSAINPSVCNNDYFKPTTMPLNKDFDMGCSTPYKHQHRRSLVNRSFSTHHQKSVVDISDFNDSELVIDPAQNNHKTVIHKSYSMHLRDGSPERSSLVRVKSSSLEDDEEPKVIAQLVTMNLIESATPANKRQMNSIQDVFNTLKERHQLLNDSDSDQAYMCNIDLVDSSAGLLFTTNLENCLKVSRSMSRSHMTEELIRLDDQTEERQQVQQQQQHKDGEATFLLNSNLTTNHISDTNEFFKANSFGEDEQILRKIEAREQKPNFSDSVDFLHGDDLSSEETRSNKLSESITDPSNDIDFNSLKNVPLTPNFKLASLINEASNVQWSKWTSSRNSKSVYKGIKNAATGIVSSLQEIKSSFSMSNSATPSKLLTTAQHKSTTTREMLSQWATQWGYFSSQTSRMGDDDEDHDSDLMSSASNDLLRLSNDEDIEQSTNETSDFKFCHKLFVALDKHHCNSGSREDLVGHLSESDSVADDEIAIEIKLTTCSRCNVCHSLLYDEEIMERWSHNESNLNTRCIYCRAKIVPLMTIQVEDRRFATSATDDEMQQQQQQQQGEQTGKETVEVTDDLVDLNFKEQEQDGGKQQNSSSTTMPSARNKRISQANNWCQQNFTVPYLSPIVLRKELENVFEGSGDNCPASCRFIDEHPIIFWNLLWYFSRINAPTHLGLLCLDSKSILNGRKVPEEVSKRRNKVVVRTLWDNEKLHRDMGKPLYRMLERCDPSAQVQAILCDEVHFTRNFLEKVINLIKSAELHKAMNMVLNARLKSSTKFSFDKNRHNLYRDLIFLIKMSLGSGKLYMDNFEREYKKAFESLNFQQVALNRFDRPPTIGSLFCRKCFKEPSLIKRNS